MGLEEGMVYPNSQMTLNPMRHCVVGSVQDKRTTDNPKSQDTGTDFQVGGDPLDAPYWERSIPSYPAL